MDVEQLKALLGDINLSDDEQQIPGKNGKEKEKKEPPAPIIIKKRRVKKSHGHSSAWKVAYADFITALMAFFLLMWVIETTSEEEKAAISTYFAHGELRGEGIVGPGGASPTVINGGGINAYDTKGDVVRRSEMDQPASLEEASDEMLQAEAERREQLQLAQLKATVEQRIDETESLSQYKEHLYIEVTPEGLRIQIVDRKNKFAFNPGSWFIQPFAYNILKNLGDILQTVPNQISISGHTDAQHYTKKRDFSNWELSVRRANAARKALIAGGLNKTKVSRVVGLADTVLLDPSKPNDPINRRISLLVLKRDAEQKLRRMDGGFITNLKLAADS